MNWNVRHKKSFLSVTLSIVSHMRDNVSELKNPLLGTCRKPLKPTWATCDMQSPQLKQSHSQK